MAKAKSATFKVGDIVECISRSHDPYGEVGEVVAMGDDNNSPTVNFPNWKDRGWVMGAYAHCWYISERALKLVDCWIES